jgi:hypothetical protein
VLPLFCWCIYTELVVYPTGSTVSGKQCLDLLAGWTLTSVLTQLQSKNCLPCFLHNEMALEMWCDVYQWYIRGPFEKFVDSPYYYESKLRGSVVTVSFSKYLPWQAMHFLQRSTHFSRTCCRQFAASFRRIVEQAVLTTWSLFSVSKALPLLENRSSSHCLVSNRLNG